MRPSRRRRSSSRAAEDRRLVPGVDRRARRPGGDRGTDTPRTLPSRRLGAAPLAGPGDVCAREGGGGCGGSCARAAVSLPAVPGLPEDETPAPGQRTEVKQGPRVPPTPCNGRSPRPGSAPPRIRPAPGACELGLCLGCVGTRLPFAKGRLPSCMV